ncbi:hypothetical protein M422DRAFT_50117 [Sphaerobolus stellatus SS14]|uniref:Uncharacterized protein n=1 Tax=Sphaerobolus stellatus (strain SS14) TaxID=990650 RepID=A0A0C9UTR7_SPHS4|nr:hypothetical protein M422DRAFT_50117 [Sphaerobolus stellatus SS14]
MAVVIQSIVADNTFNNDMMMEELKSTFFEEGIIIDALIAWGECLPHIVHLAALKLLLGIGRIFTTDLKDGDQQNYQDSATLLTSHEDDNVVLQPGIHSLIYPRCL